MEDTEPAWSSDKRTIAFTETFYGTTGCTCFGSHALFYTLATKAVSRPNPDPAPSGIIFNNLEGLNYAPGGKTLLYVYTPSAEGGDPHATPGIYRWTPTAITLVVASGVRSGVPHVANPTWAPHLGALILYSDTSAGTANVVLANSSGTGAHVLIANASEPDWQPVR